MHYSRLRPFLLTLAALCLPGCLDPVCWETATCVPWGDGGVDAAQVAPPSDAGTSSSSLTPSATASEASPHPSARLDAANTLDAASILDAGDTPDSSIEPHVDIDSGAPEPADASMDPRFDTSVACEDTEFECEANCTLPSVRCGKACVDPLTDNNYCGANEACAGGEVCEPGTACEQGHCLIQCSAEQIRCNKTCIAPDTHPLYCGASGSCTGDEAGEECSETEICRGGACRSWSRTSVIATNATDGISEARIAVTDTGIALVVWNTSGQESPELRAHIYDPTTGSWSAAPRVDDGSTASGSMQVFAEGPSSFVVVWSNYADQVIESRRWTGTDWSDITRVTDYTAFAVAGDGQSRGIVTWTENDDEGEQGTVRARIWNSVTHTWGSRTTLHTSDRWVTNPVPAIDKNGQAFVVWHGYTDITYANWEVWGTHYDATSGTWSAGELIGTAPQRQGGFQLVIAESGDLLAYWTGIFQGVIWRASSSSWLSITPDGTYYDASFCSVGGEDAVAVVRQAGVETWAQRWDGASQQFVGRTSLGSDDSPMARCNTGAAVAATNTWARRWDENLSTWGPAYTFTKSGYTADIAVSSNGSALVARVADDDGTAPYSELTVEHFE